MKLLIFYLFLLNYIESFKLTNSAAVYYGYISENIRVDVNSNVYIRFIDSQKPFIIRRRTGDCEKIVFHIVSGNEDDYFEEPFCDSSCLIHLKLKSNREQLNREALDLYRLNVTIDEGEVDNEEKKKESSFEIIVRVIDDNDNDPLFDKYEYQFEISDLVYLPAMSIVGQIKANDADLARNAELFYFVNKFNPLFGCVRTTGEIYMKYDSKYLFKNVDTSKQWLTFEAKSIDNGPKIDFYDYLVENQTQKVFKQQNFDTTMVTIRLNQRGLNDIKKTNSINVKLIDDEDNRYLMRLESENEKQLNYHLNLSQQNGLEFIKFSLDKLNNSIYALNYELEELSSKQAFDTNITLSVQVCLIANEICVEKLVINRNLKQLFTNLCKFELDMQTPFDLIEVEQSYYRITLDERAKVGDTLMKLQYRSSSNAKPYYLNMNLCKYVEIKQSNGLFKFEFNGHDSLAGVVAYIDARNGLVRLKNVTKSFTLAFKAHSVDLDNLIDDFKFTIEVDASKARLQPIKNRISSIPITNLTTQIEAFDGILSKDSVVFDLKTRSCQLIESTNNMFRVQSIYLTTAFDYKFNLDDFILNRTQTFLARIQCESLINLIVSVIPTGIPFNMPMAYLETNLFHLNEVVSKIAFNSQVPLNQIFKIKSKFLTLNNQEYENLPFRYDVNTNQLTFMNRSTSGEFKFKIRFVFNFQEDSFKYYLDAQVNFKPAIQSDVTQFNELKCDTSTIQALNFINTPKWAAYLQIYGKSQLLGFVRLKGLQTSLTFEIYNITAGVNQSIFELNSQNGALYLNDNTFSLLRRQYQQPRQQINLFVRVNSSSTDSKLCRVRIRIQPTTNSIQVSSPATDNLKQTFYTNTNNLLNFLLKGNEFSPRDIRLDENSAENTIVLNLRELIRQNFNSRKYYSFESILDSLNFTLSDNNPLFRIDSSTSNLLTNYQFNYETRQHYDLKIKINQFLTEYELDSINDQLYTYFLDLRINIVNRVDELLTSKWPIYYLEYNLEQLSESEEDVATLFQVPVVDFDMSEASQVSYKCSIMNKALRGIFHATKNLTIVIDRDGVQQLKANSEYEIDVKLSDNFDRVYKFKLLITFVDAQSEPNVIDTDEQNDDDVDLNSDSKPIVNDINLNLYDNIFDSTKPLTQIIIFNLDHKSTYNFQLTRVQVTFSDKKQQKTFNRTFLNDLFHINSSNGYLFAQHSQLPCSNCSFSISYRINKTTPVYSRSAKSDQQADHTADYYDYNNEFAEDGENYKVTTRRGLIKLQVMKLDDDILASLPIKTFKLALNETIYLNKNLKLGEKLTEIRVQRDLQENVTIPNPQMTHFFLMNNEDLSKQIFYLSNHDGSLYLIKKLNFNLKQTFIFNLTIQVTNMLGQFEFYNLNLCLNNKRPVLNVGNEQKFVIDIDVANINRNFESKSLSLKQAENSQYEENAYKIESCYYFSTYFQISKNFSSTIRYPLCNELDFDRKTAAIEVKINSIVKFLLKSSDLLVVNGSKWIVFHLDYSVYNSLSSKSDLSRVEIKLNLNHSPKYSTIETPAYIDTKVADSNLISFKRSEYYLKVTDAHIGSQLIDLSSEIQFVNNPMNQTFKPFDLEFRITNAVDFIHIIKYFGVVYLKRKSPQYFIKLNLVCNHFTQSASSTLMIEFERSNIKEIEWTHESLNAFLVEDSPIYSIVQTSENQKLRLTDYVSNYSVGSYFTFNLLDSTMYTYFELDHNVGTLRTKFSTLDNEKFTVCIVLCGFNEFCSFNRRNRILRVNIEVKKSHANEDESLIEILESKSRLKSSDLLPGLSLFKIKCREEVKIFSENKYFEMYETPEKHTNEIYLSNFYKVGDQDVPGNLSAELMVLNRIETVLRVEIEHEESSPLENAVVLGKLMLSRVVHEGESIYKFNISSEFHLLNHKYLFYLDNNHLYIRTDRVPSDSQYHLYFQDMNENRFYTLNVEMRRDSDGFILPNALYHSFAATNGLNLKLFSMKFNMSARLEDLLDTNQTEPLITVTKNSSITSTLCEPAMAGDSIFIQTLFKLDPQNGFIYVNKTSVNELNTSTLDRVKKFVLLIKIDDQNELELRIDLIKHENYNRTPSFKHKIYYYEIADLENEVFVDNFNKYLQNKNNENIFYYDLIEGDAGNQFFLDFQTGDLYLRNTTHLKIHPTYVFTIKVFNIIGYGGLYYTNLTVFINFTNVYEFESREVMNIEFLKQEFHVELDENLPEMSLVFKLNEQMNVKSFNLPLKYSLENHFDSFYLNETSGYLYSLNSFDYEYLELLLNSNTFNDTVDLTVSKELVVKVTATYNYNRKTSCFVRVKIRNLNDNDPYFLTQSDNYKVYVPNTSSTQKIFITKFSAFDDDIVAKDQKLAYSIFNSYEESFYIDEVSGILYLNPTKFSVYELNYDKNKSFNLEIFANDTLFSALMTVNVQVIKIDASSPSHNSSQILVYNCSINEDALPGTHVITLNVNDDSFKYYIINGDVYNQFDLNSDNGKLYTRLLLDREFIGLYNLDILAVGHDSKYLSKVKVTINDINDNRPVCNESIRVLNDQNMLYAQFSAYDADSITKFYYSLKSREGQLPVKIDRLSGMLKINNAFQGNYNSEYEFYVRIADQDDYYCLTKVKLELEDYSLFKSTTLGVEPHFSKYVFVNQIYENVEKYTQIDVLNINDRLLYGLVRFNLISDTNLVRLDPKFGYLQVNTAKFDREMIGNWLNFTVQVDLSTSNYYLEILDRNDNLPHFVESTEEFLDIEENIDENSLIFKLHAIDSDKNSKVSYKILTLKNNCCSSLYDLYANRVEISLNDTTYFYLNENTGELFTKKRFDFEKNEQFIIYFMAIDPEFNYTTVGLDELDRTIFKLNLRIIDLNDNHPEFDKSTKDFYFLNENSEINTTITIIKAFDLDKTDEIVFSIVNNSEYFAIDKHTGRLYTTASLDYEKHEKEYYLRIQIENPGELTTRNYFDIRIEILNLNDNKPKFLPENETLFINEKFGLGLEVYKFRIIDHDIEDKSLNFNYTFVIVSQCLILPTGFVELSRPIFSINKNLSLILIEKPIQNQTYLLQIRVYDVEDFSLHSDTWLEIHILKDIEPTIINLDVVLIENQYNLIDKQVIYKFNPGLTLTSSEHGMFKIEKNGALRVSFDDEKLLLSSQYTLDLAKTTRMIVKFIKFHSDCLHNLIRLKISYESGDYVDELKEMLKFLFSLNSLEQVMILSNYVINDETSEILFAISRNINPSQCYSSKLIKKFLIKNSEYLLENYSVKLINSKYVTACNSSHSDICFANSNCKIIFYYDTNRQLQCTNDTNCVVYPMHKLACPSLTNLKSKGTNVSCKTSKPCQNDGICKQIKSRYNCFCKNGFTGKHCETDIDECDLYQPCFNATQCYNTFGSFVCNCSTSENCYNHTFQQLYSKLSNQFGHQSTSISSSLSSIVADEPFHKNSGIINGNDAQERSFLNIFKLNESKLTIIGGIIIVIFIFLLILFISLFIYKLKRMHKSPKIPIESTSTSNRDIDEIDEIDGVCEDDDEDNERKAKKASKSFFRRKAKTYSSTSSKKKLVLNSDKNNHVKLKLLNNDLNLNSVHNTFQREVKLKNYVDQSTTTTKTLEKNLIKEASKKILSAEESEKSTSIESLNNKTDSIIKINNTPKATTTIPNIISPDYNYIQSYNSNKKIKMKNINKEDDNEASASLIEHSSHQKKQEEQLVVIINEQNNLDKDDSTIIEDCQGM